MANLGPLSNFTTAATALSNLILVTPNTNLGYQPQNAPVKNGETTPQVDPVLFHYEGENSISLESDITDHYVEDNTTVQDQIALRPETINVHGYIGELNNVVPKALEPLKTIADKLTIVDAYTPALSTTALLAFNQATQLYAVGVNAANSAISAWNSLTGAPQNQNKQQIAFQQFYGYWKNRTLFTVQTPWAIFQNMAIRSLRAVQDADTRVITDFEISFKQMRFASTITSLVLPQSQRSQGRLSTQSAATVDLGIGRLVPATETLLGSIA